MEITLTAFQYVHKYLQSSTKCGIWSKVEIFIFEGISSDGHEAHALWIHVPAHVLHLSYHQSHKAQGCHKSKCHLQVNNTECETLWKDSTTSLKRGSSLLSYWTVHKGFFMTHQILFHGEDTIYCLVYVPGHLIGIARSLFYLVYLCEHQLW